MRFFDTWTLLAALARKTERVHVGTNVLSIPLRPPAVLAKMAATLDVLCDGRLELGIGAGAYWPGIEAFGVKKRSPGEAVTAFEEAADYRSRVEKVSNGLTDWLEQGGW